MDSIRRLLKHEPVDSKRLPTELLIRNSSGPVATNQSFTQSDEVRREL
jgi:hypothetical protein